MKPFLRPRYAGMFLSLLLFVSLIVFIAVLKNIDALSEGMGCANKIIQKLNSKEEKYTVYQFNRLCGATAPDTLQMSIQPFGSSFDNEKYQSFLVLDSRARVVGVWRGPRDFSVKLESVTEMYRNEPKSREIGIQYIQ
ncbi:hypothetical protein ACFQPC_14695 [Herminiimonas glaciei]|uniref:Uncharacterized protein n=1 Tax=Herminiimonas glaciei TaxID=523788 RepID=A0ABW2IE92_9BURK